MSKTISRRHPLQQANVKRRITRAFVPLPEGYVEKIPLRLQPMFFLLWSMGKGMPLTECYRVLAARLKRDIRTAQQYAYDLQALGVIRIETHKIGPCRNGSNTFHFPELVGFIALEDHGGLTVEKPVQSVNTETEAPREVSRGVSYARLRWEHNRSQNHPPALRLLHEQNAALLSENRFLRKRQQSEGNRLLEMAAKASLGRYTGPTMEVSDEILEDLRRRIAAKEAAGRERMERLLGTRR